MSSLVSVLAPVLVAPFVLALLLYVTLAVGCRARWSLEQGGIALHAASLLFIPLHVKWEELDWIRVGSGVVLCPGTNLDARVLVGRHVVLHRTRGFAPCVTFTPSKLPELEVALSQLFDHHPDWRRTRWGWLRRGCPPPAWATG